MKRRLLVTERVLRSLYLFTLHTFEYCIRRPSTGLKTRTFPEAVTAGLMWHDGDGHAGIGRIRHECNEGDGLGPYGWVEHDGVSYGRQEVADDRAGVRIVTSVVKPAQLEGLEAQKHEYSDGE